jgi:hypothetical protein
MNVDELQMHLTNLAHLLSNAGAGKAAKELDEFCELLQPHGGKKLKDFVALITSAGQPPAAPKPRTSKAKKDPAAVEAALSRLVDLYSRAAEPTVTREEIVTALDDLDRLGLTEKELKEFAPRVNVPPKFRKAELLAQIRAALLGRKGLAERVGV